MSWYILVVAVFYLDGTPASWTKEIPSGQPCGFQEAQALAVERATAEFNRDWILWRCDTIPNPPALQPLAPSRNGYRADIRLSLANPSAV